MAHSAHFLIVLVPFSGHDNRVISFGQLERFGNGTRRLAGGVAGECGGKHWCTYGECASFSGESD